MLLLDALWRSLLQFKFLFAQQSSKLDDLELALELEKAKTRRTRQIVEKCKKATTRWEAQEVTRHHHATKAADSQRAALHAALSAHCLMLLAVGQATLAETVARLAEQLIGQLFSTQPDAPHVHHAIDAAALRGGLPPAAPMLVCTYRGWHSYQTHRQLPAHTTVGSHASTNTCSAAHHFCSDGKQQHCRRRQ